MRVIGRLGAQHGQQHRIPGAAGQHHPPGRVVLPGRGDGHAAGRLGDRGDFGIGQDCRAAVAGQRNVRGRGLADVEDARFGVVQRDVLAAEPPLRPAPHHLGAGELLERQVRRVHRGGRGG